MVGNVGTRHRRVQLSNGIAVLSTYDRVGNPVEVRDWRDPEEWPAGAKPVTRKLQYDEPEWTEASLLAGVHVGPRARARPSPRRVTFTASRASIINK